MSGVRRPEQRIGIINALECLTQKQKYNDQYAG